LSHLPVLIEEVDVLNKSAFVVGMTALWLIFNNSQIPAQNSRDSLSKRIDLNDPVIKYLPYFKLKDERYKNITILHLLSHTSGLPDIEAEELYTS
jgi:hypothetical protein